MSNLVEVSLILKSGKVIELNYASEPLKELIDALGAHSSGRSPKSITLKGTMFILFDEVAAICPRSVVR